MCSLSLCASEGLEVDLSGIFLAYHQVDVVFVFIFGVASAGIFLIIFHFNYYIKSKMKGKVAVITASSTGIGKAIAIELAQEGVKVIISSRNQEHVSSTVR